MASALTTTSASGANSRISGALRHRLSAVPCWKPSRSSWPRRGWRISRPPVVRSRSHGRPLARWSLSEMGLYCWAIHTSDRPALWALESGKSISRCVPANGTAGLARVRVSSCRRPPAPPASTTTRVRMRGTVPCCPRSGAASPRSLDARKRATEDRMSEPGAVYDLSPVGVVIEMRRTAAGTGGAYTEFDVSGRPRAFLAQPHAHEHQTERHEVLLGSMRLVVDG